MCLDNDDDDVTIGRCRSKNALLVDNPSKEDLRQEIFSLDNSNEEEGEDNITTGQRGGEERILTGDQEMKNQERVDENAAARGYIDECILNLNRKNDDDLSKLKRLEYTLYGEKPIEWAKVYDEPEMRPIEWPIHPDNQTTRGDGVIRAKETFFMVANTMAIRNLAAKADVTDERAICAHIL